MKTREEMNALKNEVEALNAKLGELTEDEMKLVTGGCFIGVGGFPVRTESGGSRRSVRRQLSVEVSSRHSGLIS